jgi:ribosomal protein S17E
VTVTISTARTLIVLALLPAFVVQGQQPHPSAPAPPPAKISSGSRIQPLRPGFRFPYGQTLNYEGEWRFFTAGVASVRIDPAGNMNHITASADSTGVVALLYKVQDRFESYFDAKTLCSAKLVKRAEEGSHRRETVITFDYTRNKSVLDEHNLKTNQQKKVENDIPGCVTDILSGILYVSSLPLQVGQSYMFPVNDGGKTITVQAKVEGREQVKTPAGTFQTVRLGSEGNNEVLKNRGRISIWYTDDDRHLPVQMRAKLFWGTLTIYLTSITK